jgi:hypothetical protein
MTEPTLTCPSCHTEIKLTESLAAPLLADTRRHYEDQLARQEAAIVARETALQQRQDQIAVARQSIDTEVASKLDQERGRIAVAGEARGAGDRFSQQRVAWPLRTIRQCISSRPQ